MVSAQSDVEAGIGRRLRSRRRLLGLTQKDVAASVGVTPQMVHKWETAQTTIYAAMVLELARALAVKPSYFYLDAEPQPGRPDAGANPTSPEG